VTDNLRETLSAFIDGEASEIEIHRLLRQGDDDARSWVHYQQIRAVISGDGVLSAERHETLRDRIRQSIGEEETFDERPGFASPLVRIRSAVSTYAKPAAAFGVAASLFVAVIVGFDMNRDIDGSNQPGGATVAESPRNAPIPAQTVAAGNTGPAPAAENELELRELDEETLEAVRAYLNQHDRSVRMQPVIYDKPNGN